MHKAIIFDPHIGAAILTIIGQTMPIQDPRMYLPIPSREIFALADYARFNMFETHDDGKKAPITEIGINIMLMHAMKSNPSNAISQPGTERVTPYVLQPLFS